MRALLDTHSMLWWRLDPGRLSARALQLLRRADSELVLSAASTWELAIQVSLGKLHLPEPVAAYVPRVLAEERWQPLSVTHAHSAAVADLPLHHRDPFDRLLVAQAMLEGIPLVSSDARLATYAVTVIW